MFLRTDASGLITMIQLMRGGHGTGAVVKQGLVGDPVTDMICI
jgi:hypothetical protein